MSLTWSEILKTDFLTYYAACLLYFYRLGIDIDNLSDLDSDEDSSYNSDSNMGNAVSLSGVMQPGTSSENSCSSDSHRTESDENAVHSDQKSTLPAEMESEHDDLHKVSETVVDDQQPGFCSKSETVSQTSTEKEQHNKKTTGEEVESQAGEEEKHSGEKLQEKISGSTEEPKVCDLLNLPNAPTPHIYKETHVCYIIFL